MELLPLGRWCMFFVLTIPLVHQCGAQNRDMPCPRGTFGSPDCRGTCHCHSGEDFCRWEDGTCTDSMCSYGWMNPPACQTACPYGMFGNNCALLCHCPPNDACNSISGLCSSDQCDLGWGGASCQQLLPVLVKPPDVTATTGTQITLSWPKWVSGQTGLGEGDVISHTLQQIDNVANTWQDVVNLQDSSAFKKFTYTVMNLKPNTAYKYRIQLVMNDDNKPLPSVPGPESSRWIVPSSKAPSDAPTKVTAEMTANEETKTRVAWTTTKKSSVTSIGTKIQLSSSPIAPSINLSDISFSRSNIAIVIEQHFMKNNWIPYDYCEIDVQYIESVASSSLPPPSYERRCVDDGNVYIYDLLPATQYNITVTMKDFNGTVWMQYSVVQFTGPDYPPHPPPLAITEASNTSITVKFSPGKYSADIPSQRLVVTEKLRSNERSSSHFQEFIENFAYQIEDSRAFPKPQHLLFNATSANQLNLPFYVTGLIDSDAGSFVVGDGQTYKGFSYPASVSCNYNNVPLVPNSLYMVWFVWENVFDGMSIRLTSQPVGPVLTVFGGDFTSTVTPPPSTPTPTPTSPTTSKARGSDKSVLLINSRTEQSVILELRNIDKITGESCEINIYDLDAGSRVSSPLINKVCSTSCFFDIRHLRPATRYKVNVQLSKSGVPKQYSIVLCTAPLPPPSPPTPVVSEVSATGFTVTLATRKSRADIYLQFVVVIEKLESTKSNFKDAVTSERSFLFEDSRSTVKQKHIMVNAETAEKLRSSFYVAGILDSNGRKFVVGDSRTYRGVCDPAVVSCTYSSVPLEPLSSYLVWFVLENSLDGITRRKASQSAGPVRTLADSESQGGFNPARTLPDPSLTSTPTSTGEPGLSGIVVFLIVLAVVLFCILFLFLLIVWLWKRAKRNRKTKSEIVRAPYTHPEPSSVNRELAVSYLNSLLISRTAQKESNVTSVADDDYIIPDACFVYECGSSLSRSCPVPVEKLRDFCSEYLLLDSGCFLEDQFLLLPNCLTDSVSVAMLTFNVIHNRSAQVVPYDRNRVKLKHAVPQFATYVNASFVRTIGRRYCIVTQCPTLSTLGHFWQMVWERGTTTIVMLMDSEAPDSRDFDCYWPEIPGRYHAYDSIHVELVSVNTFANYSVRHFKIGELNAVRERHVFHWQYMSWSKGGVPEHPIPFLSFVKRIREERKSDSGFLVHCRTGGGRSGVYVAVDTLLTQGHNTGVVDVLRLVTLLHTERSNLVKSFVQYRFIYECLCEEFDHNPSRYLAERFVATFEGLETSETGLKALTNEQQVLMQLPVYTNSLTRLLFSRKSIVPEACMSFPNADEDDDLDHFDPHPFQTLSGFIRCDMFIASRSPSSTYRDEFWHSITDNRVNCIVMLNKMADLPDVEHLLPQMGQSVNSRHFSVLCASVKASPSNVYIAYNLKVRLRHLSDEVDAYSVRLFEFTKWPSDDEVPAVDVMLELLEQLRKWLNRYSSNRPILLFSACGIGKSRAALLMVLWYVLEQSENEGILDIFSTSRLIRSYIVSSMDHRDHYHFMYLAVRDYWKSNLTYYTLPAESSDQQPSAHRKGWKPPTKRHSTSASRTISKQGQSSTGELPPKTIREFGKPRLEGQSRADPLRRIQYRTDLEETEKESVTVTDKGSNFSGMSANTSKTNLPESAVVEKPAKQTDVRLGFPFPPPGDQNFALKRHKMQGKTVIRSQKFIPPPSKRG